IVGDYGYVIGGQANIDFDHIRAEFRRLFDGLHRIFLRMSRCATMGDTKHVPLVWWRGFAERVCPPLDTLRYPAEQRIPWNESGGAKVKDVGEIERRGEGEPFHVAMNDAVVQGGTISNDALKERRD